ncbi:MAG: hypothetical protein M4579_006627 [Chaenotheca gracillima]|nr:MAG: hypothetical protein M4579_006627 [Chaenotheca gracillima]
MAESAERPTHPELMDRMELRPSSCTHIATTRIHGQNACFGCGQIPRIGWIYRCIHDFHNLASLSPPGEATNHSSTAAGTDSQRNQVSGAYKNVPNIHRLSPEEKTRLYTPAQIETLTAQKQHVQDVIEDLETQISAKHYIDAANRQFLEQAAKDGRSYASTPPSTPTSSRPTPGSSRSTTSPFPGACNIGCCHRCAPNWLSRSWSSLTAIAHSGPPRNILNRTSHRPVASQHIVANLGLKRPVSHSIDTLEAEIEVTDAKHPSDQTSIQQIVRPHTERRLKRLFSSRRAATIGGLAGRAMGSTHAQDTGATNSTESRDDTASLSMNGSIQSVSTDENLSIMTTSIGDESIDVSDEVAVREEPVEPSMPKVLAQV